MWKFRHSIAINSLKSVINPLKLLFQNQFKMSRPYKSSRYANEKKRGKINEQLREKQSKRARVQDVTDLFDHDLEKKLNQLDQAQQANLVELEEVFASATGFSNPMPSNPVSSSTDSTPATSREVQEGINQSQLNNSQDFQMDGNILCIFKITCSNLTNYFPQFSIDDSPEDMIEPPEMDVHDTVRNVDDEDPSDDSDAILSEEETDDTNSIDLEDECFLLGCHNQRKWIGRQ